MAKIIHDPEGDHVYPMPERYSHLKKERGYKCVRYGHALYLIGPGYTTKISDEIRGKINDNKSVVICVTGPPGQGKTYFGMRYAQTLDLNFNIRDIPPPPPNEDDGQITFSREHLAYLTGENSPLKMGQVILTDESHWGIGARSWQNRDQQEVVNYLAAIRSKGYVLIIVVLHTRMIDALLRDFVVNYEFHVTKRGEARVYRRWFPVHAREAYKKKLGLMKQHLPDDELCNYDSCLRGRNGCQYLHKPLVERCMTIRAIYERRKRWFLDEKGRRDLEEIKERRYSDLNDVIEAAGLHVQDIPIRNTHRDGRTFKIVHREKLYLWIQSIGHRVRYRDISHLADKLQEQYIDTLQTP